MRAWLSIMMGLWMILVASPQPAGAQGVLDRLEKAVDQIAGPAKGDTQTANATTGYLGLVATQQTGPPQGVVVTQVAPNSPAALAGIRVGDQIISVNGQRIGTLNDMNPLVRRPPGTHLTIEIRRGNTVAKGEVTLAVRPGQPAGAPTIDELPPPLPAIETQPQVKTPPPPPSAPARASLGVNVLDVTPATRKQYRLTVRSGAVIRAIRPGSAAAKAGLPLGGAIVAVDGRIIKSADDLVTAVQVHHPGDVIDITYYDGDRMARKKVELGQSGAAAAPAATLPPAVVRKPAPRVPAPPPSPAREPALRLGTTGRDRPLLRRLGQALDTLVQPNESSTPPSAARTPQAEAVVPGAAKSVPALPANDLAELHREIKMLHDQLQTLQRRLDRLEKQINSKTTKKKP